LLTVRARTPKNERERLAALRGYELLDTDPEDAFDALTRVAASLCRVPIAVVSLVDDNRHWFKSQCGLDGVTSTVRIRRSEMDEYRLARAENERACSRLKNQTAQLRALAERVPPVYRDAPII
jgi:hypothetical protein